MPAIGNPTDPKDPWTTAQTGYSKEKIYTRSTDTYGNGETLHIKVSPAVFAAIQEAREKVPQLRTAHDVVRDAIVHRLHEYNDWLDTGVNMQPIDIEVRRAEVDALMANMTYWEDTIKQIDATLNKLMSAGDYATASYLIEQNSEVESMTPPFLAKLGDIIDKYRRMLLSIGYDA